MIELQYKIDLKKDHRSFESCKFKNLTKGEASNLLLFLETVKLDIITKEFELGDGGMEIIEND
jgi:hypothetical protein